MRGARRRLIAVAAALVAALLVLLAGPAPAPAEEPQPEARAWILVDAEDGEVLAARAADRPASIASTTKLMTAYVARRRLGLDQVVVAPPYDGAPVESLLGLEPGERIEVRDLLAGLLLPSGNDAAFALAQAASGSVPDFVAEMNRAARRLGLAGTSFANPIGLDQRGNASTPADLATLAIELRRDPFLGRLFDRPRVRLGSGARRPPVVNRNELVREVPWVDGVKTGRTVDAGYVLVGSGTRRGVTLVSVVLGAPSEADRDAATLALLRYGFSLYRRETVIDPSERLTTAALRFRDERLPLIAARALRLTVREGQRVETEVVAPVEVSGPVARDERLGTAFVTVDGEPAGQVPLLAARAVSEATLVDRIDSALPGSRPIVWLLAAALATLGFFATLTLARRGPGRGRAAPDP